MIPEAMWAELRRLADDLAALDRLEAAATTVGLLEAEDLRELGRAMFEDVLLRAAELRRRLRP